MRRKLIDLKTQRTALLEGAETLLKEGKREEYRAEMAKVTKMNEEIKDVEDLVREQDRKFLGKAADPAEEKDKAEERGNELMKGHEVTFSPLEVAKALFVPKHTEKSVTLATGTMAQPTGAGTDIRDALGYGVGAIIDQVYVQDLNGMSAYLEPYVISEPDAKGAKVTTAAGTARAASDDPKLGVAKIAPYELTTTSYVDRNISKLTPANYYAKIFAMAMKSMRRSTVGMIFNGDGQSTNDMFGVKTAKNMAGSPIYASLDVEKVGPDLLTELMFAYGGDEELGGNCRLYLNKKDLLALGKLRGTNEKQRLFDIVPDAANPNTGTIREGGTIVPYSISSKLTALSTSQKGSSAIQTMVYGDPMNYELGLFGPYTVRVDESVKAVERMLTILGDAMVGGNLIVDKGFVVATLPANG
ncbi:phage major capsid protein [Intestinimonas timonensis]|uniref:phage major capsid protein n=1 Tax=Intestinimonas timonensis TaxID=1689270 RepID=UPI0013EF0F05|nr:phage major capsid protein [Intestinimonas timonensis]